MAAGSNVANAGRSNPAVRYEADESPPHALAILLALQVVVLIVAGIVLLPTIVLRAAGGLETYGAWAIFWALMISGAVTVLQAYRRGRFGAGYLLFMGTSGAFMAVSITAISTGGLPLLMTLVVVSSLFQFLLAARLAMLRRIITPTVGGIVIMLIAVTIMPIAFRFLGTVPATVAAPAQAAPLTALATLLVTIAVSLIGSRFLRLWAPMLGVIVGTGVAAWFGLLQTEAIADAPWIGLPNGSWPQPDLSFTADFWLLLPAFVLVTLVSAIETYGDGIAIQRVSRRRQRAIDFKVVQGAVNADGLGNFLAGIAGTLPNTTYSTSISVVDLTGVAARRVGLYGGLLLIGLAFSPKLAAALMAIPNPVAGAYIIVLIVFLFMHGFQLVAEGGFDYEKALVVGLSFWLGIGFQDQAIYPDLLSPWARSLLDNGMTAGGLTALVLTLLFAIKNRARDGVTVPLDVAALPEMQSFLHGYASRLGWDKPAIDRLLLVAEEGLLYLLGRQSEAAAEDGDAGTDADASAGRLRLVVRSVEDLVELELAAAPHSVNLEDQLAALKDQPGEVRAEDLALRILRHLAVSVRHQQYNDVDFLTIRLASAA